MSQHADRIPYELSSFKASMIDEELAALGCIIGLLTGIIGPTQRRLSYFLATFVASFAMTRLGLQSQIRVRTMPLQVGRINNNAIIFNLVR